MLLLHHDVKQGDRVAMTLHDGFDSRPGIRECKEKHITGPPVPDSLNPLSYRRFMHGLLNKLIAKEIGIITMHYVEIFLWCKVKQITPQIGYFFL